MTKQELALEIIDRLKKEYPDADCTLDYDQAWKLLVSVRLAAQCTDARVNVVVEKLYEKYPDVKALAAAPVEETAAGSTLLRGTAADGGGAGPSSSGNPGPTQSYTPDAALANWYDADARMGMHQDRDEVSRAPVVSLSIGDACTFRFGNSDNRNRPSRDVVLESGDAFVFGGASRLAYHGVTAVHAGTAPDGCGLEAGRINITLRETGLG